MDRVLALLADADVRVTCFVLGEVASAHPGTNSNVLADETLVDALSGNAVLNGIPVELEPVAAREPAEAGAAA